MCVVKEENQLVQIVLWLPHGFHNMCQCAHTIQQTNVYLKQYLKTRKAFQTVGHVDCAHTNYTDLGFSFCAAFSTFRLWDWRKSWILRCKCTTNSRFWGEGCLESTYSHSSTDKDGQVFLKGLLFGLPVDGTATPYFQTLPGVLSTIYQSWLGTWAFAR